MSKIIRFAIPFLLIVCFAAFKNQGNNGQKRTYFNQNEPGVKAQKLAPEIFSQAKYKLHGFPTISPDGLEVYWPVLPPRILHSKVENESWTKPVIAPFSQGNLQAPVFSPDGKRLYFQMSHKTGFGSLDIWYIEKKDSNWGEKVNTGPPNSPQLESQPSFTKDGTMYYTGSYSKGHLNRGIYRCAYKNNKYGTPELLPESINSEFLDYTPFISPDERFLLFASTRPSKSESDIRLYVTFRNNDGSWTTPGNLNRVMGFDKASKFPCLTPDGKCIIFQSGNEYYWVSSKILETFERKIN